MALSKNLLYNFLLSLSNILFPLISIPYISRILNPGGIGQVSFIDSFTYYFIAIAEFGIIVYAVREIAKNRDDRDKLSKLVSELLCLHCITSACSLFLYAISVFFLWHHFHDIRLIFFSVSFLLVNFFACEWYFWGKEEFRYLTIRSLIVRGLGLFSIFIIIKAPEDYYLYYLVIVGSAIVAHIWNLTILFREVPVSFRNINWKRHIPFVFTTFQISILYSVIIMLDNVILGIVSTAASVAFYHFSVKIVRITGGVVSDTLLVFYPRMVSLIRDNEKAKSRAMIRNTTGFLFLITMPMCVGIYLLSEPFTRLYFGSSFYSIAGNLKILAIYPLARVLALGLNKQILMANEKDRHIVKGLFVSCIFFLISFIVLAKFYQDKGACIATLLTECLILAMNYYYAKKEKLATQLFNNKDVWHALAGSLILVPVVWLIKESIANDLWAIVVSAITGSAFYFLFVIYVLRNQILKKILSIAAEFATIKKPGNE